MLATGVAGLTIPGRAAAQVTAGRISLRGINIPDWARLIDGRAPASATFAALSEHGFDTIRLPVNSDDWTGDATQRHLAALLVENALDMAVRTGFSVMLDFHPSTALRDGLTGDPEQGEASIVAAWAELSQVAASFPHDMVMPELLNEPPMERARWLPLRDLLAETVRKACPRHTMIWGADRVQGIWETLNCPPLIDDNCMAAVHYYTPMGFTHQCADWDSTSLAQMKNLPFPAARRSSAVQALAQMLQRDGQGEALAFLEGEFAADWTTARIETDFADLGRWSRQTGTPVVVNEFGVLDFCVDAKSRANWTRAVRRAAEGVGAGWAYWELDQGFGLLDDDSADGFDTSLIAALMEN